MGFFVLGLLIGLLLAGVVGVLAYQRLVVLERRTRHAERLAELGTLTGGLAHEIKNPLSTVQLNLQLLQEDIAPDNPAHGRITNRLRTVQNETTRLREILDDFLRYAGRLELDRKPVELNNLLEELADFFSPQAQANGVQLRFNRTPATVVASVDARLIKQALLNLMLNSLHAMNNRGGELILSLTSTPSDAIIDVIDTGGGVPPGDVDKIFHAYYSTKKSGTGLGLPMSKRIAEEHGGSLTVKSEPGKGSDFRLVLPIESRMAKPTQTVT